MNANIKEQLERLPHKPGVYQFFNHQGSLLYVGKAKDLSKRVSSYWQKQSPSPWTNMLVSEITDIKATEVNSEMEALLLENSYIKTLKPKYNLKLRDDKTFPFLRVSKEPFPVFTITRRVRNDKARYVGPFFSATYLRTMLKMAQELYGIKTTSDRAYEARSSVPKQIGLGARSLDDHERYQTNVEAAIKFLSTSQPQMERIIKKEMHQAATDEKFERATILRNRLQSLEQLRHDQSLFSPSGAPRDYIGLVRVGKLISVYILHERDGQMINHHQFLFEDASDIAMPDLTAVILEYLYINGLPLPRDLIMAHDLSHHKSLLAQTLRLQSGRKITLIQPQRGDTKKRLQTAIDNAKSQLQLESLKKLRRENGLSDLASRLQLKKLPKRIEACDISNLGPTSIVGATIVFIDGKPAKNEYRKYKIETPEGQDDFASMRELVFRRLTQKTRPLPDLLLIDGGKGQLSAALDAMKLAEVNVPMIALAKKEELIYQPGQRDPLILNQTSDALLLLTAIRDEVHRYVISFHRHRRAKRMLA